MRRGCGHNPAALRPPKPKRPPSSPKPPPFIAKLGGRYHYSPSGAFSIDDLTLIKFISAVLDSPAFISAYTNGRSTLQAGSLSDLLILPKSIVSPSEEKLRLAWVSNGIQVCADKYYPPIVSDFN
jgi:hypothetical protein